jgi:hypothetical protein
MFLPTITSQLSFRQLGLIWELAFNPFAILLLLTQRSFFSRFVRLLFSLLIPILFFFTPSIIGKPWESAILYVLLWVAISLFLNLVMLFVNASVLRLQRDISSSASPSDDLWRQLSSPVKIQKLLASIGGYNAPARNIPVVLLSEHLSQSIMIPEAHDKKQNKIVLANLNTYQYSTFLCSCIDLSWESLFWVVDPDDFLDEILPSFIAEAIVIAAVVRFDKKKAEFLQLKKLGRWASQKTLKTIYNQVTLEEESKACIHCMKADTCSGQQHCHKVNPSKGGANTDDMHAFHTDLSLIWYMLFSYAKDNIVNVQIKDEKTFADMWEIYDGFSISCVLPHTERFRSSQAQIKKRFIYVDADTISSESVLRSLKLINDKGDINCNYVRSIGPEIDAQSYRINRWTSIAGSTPVWESSVCKKLILAALELFKASCGNKAEIAFFNRESGGEECVREWLETIEHIRASMMSVSVPATAAAGGTLGEQQTKAHVDIGVFDGLVCIGSIRNGRSDGNRYVLSVFPSPFEINVPFVPGTGNRTVSYKDVCDLLRGKDR